jgi:uncharacterized protein (DUF1697 family)
VARSASANAKGTRAKASGEPAAKGNRVHVALLRGINVGGKNMLPMKDLVGMFEAAGCGDVQSYVQSGNVVFRADPALARSLSGRIAADIADRFGHRVPVILRTEREIRDVKDENPLLAAGADPGTLHVGFLADLPTAAGAASLDPERSPPDTFVVQGREIYLCCPEGLARTKLSNAYFDTKLGTTSTVRNWRTVLELARMAAALRG